MSPLAPLGVRGYADYQRVSNFDDAVRWNQGKALDNNPFLSPVMDVSRFASIGGMLHVGTGIASVEPVWYADSTAALALGQRLFSMTQNITQPAQVMFRNLGPFCQIGFAALGGAAYQANALIFPTNRASDIDFIPVGAVLVDQEAVAVGAGATLTVYPSDYYAGPANLSFWASGVPSDAFLEYLTSAGTWGRLDTLHAAAASTWVSKTTVLPPGAWRASIFNGSGAAGTAWMIVTPSITGAA